jgi:RNA polymerase sigma-70 factor (ECF subfamily)
MRDSELDKEHDKELMARLKQGELEAFSELVKRFKDSLFSFFFRRTHKNRPVAEELTQETLLAVFLNASALKVEGGNLCGWLFTIANNKFIDWFRRRREQLLSPPDETEDDLLAVFVEDGRLSVDQLVGFRQAVRDFYECFDNLSPREQEGLQRRYLNEENRAEVALALEMTPAALDHLLSDARARLKTCLEEKGYNPDDMLNLVKDFLQMTEREPT